MSAWCVMNLPGKKVRAVVIFISAWASALLILDHRQCEGPVCGISDRYRFPRFLFILETFTLLTAGLGNLSGLFIP